MDIGDPSDFPATRRRLPSMRELGAFDADGPIAAPAPPTPETLLRTLSNAARRPDAPPVPDRAGPTATQLRRVLAKADPGTRRRLIRLYGRRDPQKSTAGSDETTRPLLRLDEHTELLCASPFAADEPSGTGRPPRFDRPAPDAVAGDTPRVLFPVYDPAEHGADLRTPRRPAAPVEGHFPPPRQPFAAPAQQVRERTPKPERPGQPAAEAADAPAPAPASASAPALSAAPVSASARSDIKPDPDRQLSLLALPEEPRVRDGVNGLLLSRRDLDEAVEDGLLRPDVAILLWKNWSARRPVIHVIDDPAPPPVESAAAADEIDGNAGDLPSGPPAQPSHDPQPATTQNPVPLESSTADIVATSLPVTASPRVAVISAAADTAPDAPAADHHDAPAEARPEEAPEPQALHGIKPGERRRRAAWLARQVWRILLAGCVLSTAARVGLWAWPHARPWIGG